MTSFQRINLGIGLAAMVLVACMAIGQAETRSGLGPTANPTLGSR